MSLYEALDRFVGAGVLACAGLVGVEMPPGVQLDGAAFANRLREHRLNEGFGAALDQLAHAIWFARERHGIAIDVAERHAAEIARLLGEVRLEAVELIAAVNAARPPSQQPAVAAPPATLSAHVASLWFGKAMASGALAQANLDPEICRFLVAEMLALVVDQPRLLSGLAPALVAHRTTLMAPRPVAVAAEMPISAPVVPANEPPRAAEMVRMPGSAPTQPQPQANVQAQAPSNVPMPSAVAEMQSRHRLPEGALRRFQAILAQQPMTAEQRMARLEELGIWLNATIAHLRKPSNDAAELRQTKLEAAAALEAGDLERAMDRLKAVREHMRDGRRRAEERIAEELQSLRLQMIDEAAATARLGELALARMELDAAADFFADAAGQLPASERVLELEYRQRQAEAIAAQAEATNEPRAVEAAVIAFRSCRRLLQADTDMRTRVRINVGLGDMLVALGSRQMQETLELEEAVGVYADAVAVIDRTSKPMQWALVQLSHAAALIDIGLRRDREHFWKLAATALMPALDVFESRGAADLAEAARAKLRAIAAGFAEQPEHTGVLLRPARIA